MYNCMSDGFILSTTLTYSNVLSYSVRLKQNFDCDLIADAH